MVDDDIRIKDPPPEAAPDVPQPPDIGNTLVEAAYSPDVFLQGGKDRIGSTEQVTHLTITPLFSSGGQSDHVVLAGQLGDRAHPGDGTAEGGVKAEELPAWRGHTWRKEGGSWHLYNAAGEKQSKYPQEVTDVQRSEDGSFKVSLKGGANLDVDDKGRLTRITYADRTYRDFVWDERAGHENELKSARLRDGRWFDHVQDRDGKYMDEWTQRGQRGSNWKGRIEPPSAESGNFAMTSLSGQNRGMQEIKRPDEVTEIRDSQSGVLKELRYPDRTAVSYDERGNIKQIDYVDRSSGAKTKREFGQTLNPETQEYELTSVKVTQGNQTHLWTRSDKKDADGNHIWLLNGKETAQKVDFQLDNATQTYTWTDRGSGESHILRPNANEQIVRRDGTVAEVAGGNIISATKGDRRFEYDYSNGKVSAVREFVYENDTWKQTPKAQLPSGQAVVTESGEPAFTSGNKTTVRRFDGTTAERSTNRDRSTVERSDGATAGTKRTKVNATDGSVREFESVRGEDGRETVTKESITRGGKTTTWERQQGADGQYTNVWENPETGEQETRKSVNLSVAGELAIEYEGGSKYTARTNGTEQLVHAHEKWKIEYAGGKPSEIHFADGTVRKYKWQGEDLASFEVHPKGGKVTTWQKIGENKYRDGSGTHWNAKIEVDRQGNYKITDLDDGGRVKTRKPDGTIIDEKDGLTTVTRDGQLISASRNGQSLEFGRGADNKVNEIRDTSTNTVWRKAGDRWQPSALDSNQAWQRPDNFQRKGDVYVDEQGTVMFLTTDGSATRQRPGERTERVLPNQHLDKLIASDKRMDDVARLRFYSHIDRIEQRTDITRQQKTQVYTDIARILDAKEDTHLKIGGKDGRALIAEQLAWHIAYPEKDAQGGNPTCSVSSVRVLLEHERPERVSRLIADVATTGRFRTNDGTDITPDKESLLPRKEERTWPNEDGNRTWVGKIWDVTAVNIHWNRRETDYHGNAITKGRMSYRERSAGDSNDYGGHIIRWNDKPSRDGHTYGSRQHHYPGLSLGEIADVYQQVTGDTDRQVAARFLQHTNRPGSRAELTTRIDSEDALRQTLSDRQAPLHRIFLVQNHRLYNQSDGRQTEHVTVGRYNRQTRDVAIDNTHYRYRDQSIPVSRLYGAMQHRPW